MSDVIGQHRTLGRMVKATVQLAKTDGVESSCSTRRHNAPYCRCLSLLGKELPNASYNSRHRSGQTCFSGPWDYLRWGGFFNRAIRRAQLMQFFSNLEPCLIGMTVWIHGPLACLNENQLDWQLWQWRTPPHE